jgi:hypothetical protein
MPTMMMHVLELPPGKLAPGRWIFWPTKPPTYEEMAKLPAIYRHGYVFDVAK